MRIWYETLQDEFGICSGTSLHMKSLTEYEHSSEYE